MTSSTQEHPPTPAGIEATVRKMCPLYTHIGLRVETLGDTIAATVPLTPANTNHLGGVHAAVQWALAEAVGGIAYFAHPELGPCWIAVRDVTIAFASVARTALRAEASFGAAQVDSILRQLDEHGTADYAVDINVRDTAGRVVTTATGHYYLRRTESGNQTTMMNRGNK
jgi:acyl-coenzyme A thioesterase PaaI-like protein